MARRHKGLTAFGVLGIVFGVIGLVYHGFLVVAVLALRSMSLHLDLSAPDAARALSLPIVLSLAISTLTAALICAAGIGVLLAQGWGRLVYVAAAVLTMLNRLASVPLYFVLAAPVSTATEAAQRAVERASAVMGDVGTIAFNVIALWFFTRAATKARFDAAAEPSS